MSLAEERIMILETKDDLDLKKIAESGQCFRFLEISEGVFRIPHKDSCLIIKEKPPGVFDLSCEEEEFDALWKAYFDMDLSYSDVRHRIDKDKDPFLFEAAESQKGIRILQQDLFETFISFIISQNRNIPAIKNSIELLCEKCSAPSKDPLGNTYYPFPTAERIAALSLDDLTECRLGYRNTYIKRFAENVASGNIELDSFNNMSDDECLKELTKIYGVGKKVASCVMLFGLHRINAFPIGVWIKRILENEYKDGYPFDKYAPYNGIYQQYMFAYYREKNS